ncbi:hypothetical protein Bca52824_042827 [Brassica carinata]|uniref:O-fucosyltransferase family protein n=1 Tax=Brassica carinata TaxID=52824 RepID=A0A8X7RXZ4_BRACI|nr:hypothetical protein Bca52824_042827 [Brassica carinata]
MKKKVSLHHQTKTNSRDVFNEDKSGLVPSFGNSAMTKKNINLTDKKMVGGLCVMDILVDNNSSERIKYFHNVYSYDVDLISEKIPVILDDSETWHIVLSTGMKLKERGIAHVNGASRRELNDSSHYANLLLINRTASPLAWFVECTDRINRSNVMLPYSFLPSMAAPRLRNAADKIKAQLGDYDAIHVRRGDKLKTRRDRFHVERTQFPHLDRDTRPEFIMTRIQKRIPPGRTLYIGSNERTPGFFSPLSARYKVAYSSNFSEILDPVIENNYQLFMVERMVMMGAKTFFKTFREYETDLTLTDDPKKNKNWEIPVYTMGQDNKVELKTTE